MADPIRVRRVRADEAPMLRSLRLRALADSPMAFGSTLAEEQARPDALWQERAVEGAAGLDRVTFIVESGGVPAGMATGLSIDDDPTAAALVGVWVDPSLRGQGSGAALVEAVTAWARERGKQRLELWVTATNTTAIGVYERSGFRPTGETEPLPHTPSLSEFRMVRTLDHV